MERRSKKVMGPCPWLFPHGAWNFEMIIAGRTLPLSEMGVELHPRQRSTQQAGYRLLAHLEWLSPQVIAVKLQKIEGNEEDLGVVTAMP